MERALSRAVAVVFLLLTIACSTVHMPQTVAAVAPPGIRARESAVLTTIAGIVSFRFERTALTIGRTVYIPPGEAVNRYLWLHEFEHVRQWRRYGIGLLPRYLLASALCLCRQNRYELAADSAAGLW